MSQLNTDVSLKALEPGTIDEGLIRKILEGHGPKGEANRLLAHDGIKLEDVTSIRLEFLNILSIGHLWMMTSLVKLDLSNNIIEKIENLEAMINLKDLSLSFNNIEKIENLDSLTNLEILTLFENCILRIENLDALKNLMILSLGNNKISNWDDMIYLRRFKALQSLNMAGNPCCSENPDGDSKRNRSKENTFDGKEIDFGDGKNIEAKCKKDEFRKYTVAHLPQLRFYEYCLVDEAEREEGQQKYGHKLLLLMEEEEKQNLAFDKAKEEEMLLSRGKAAWVDNLHGSDLIDDIFRNDSFGKALITLDENMQEIYEEFQMQFVEVTTKLYDTGLAMKEERDEEEKQFVECLKKAKYDTGQEGKSIMTEFFQEKNLYFTEMVHLVKCIEGGQGGNPNVSAGNGSRCQHKGTLGDVSTVGEEELEECEVMGHIQVLNHDFNDLCERTWEHLMALETHLYEQIEETLASFERNITDLVTTFIETAQVHFASCRELETQFNERTATSTPRYFTAMRARIAAFNAKTQMREESDCDKSLTSIKEQEEEKESYPTVPKVLEECLENKDALQNALTSSHDVHLQIIDAREDKLINEAKSWLKEKLDIYLRDEVQGNRERLHEIITVINLLREEFEELQASSITLPMLADMEITEG